MKLINFRVWCPARGLKCARDQYDPWQIPEEGISIHVMSEEAWLQSFGEDHPKSEYYRLKPPTLIL
jgi:hypothetical protein